MPTPLRLLLVEDSEDDALLLLRELKRGGFEPACERVFSAPAMSAALDRQDWDLVVADFTMPGFSGTSALAVLRARDADVPFIFVSGTIGEDVAVNAMKAGANDYIMKGNLRRLVPAVERELREAVLRREHRSIAARVEHLAYYDALTDLPNRALLHDRLGQALAAAERDHSALSLMLLDLDGFKDINDTLGHRAGDVLLQQVGRRIHETLRAVDTVARLGGDEFAVLFPGVDLTQAKVLAHRVLEAVAEPIESEGLRLDVRASLGIALYPEHGATSDLLIQRADVAMYAAKATRSGWCVYSPDVNRHSRQRLGLGSELHQAIARRQFLPHYQPKVSLRDGRVLGLEALTYWQHPTAGLLPPARFFALAEQIGVIRDLTFAVIDSALRDARRWRGSGWELSVAVNLSPRILHDERFPDEVAMLIESSGLTPSCLQFEITEDVIIADPVRALNTASRLKDMGIRLSIDDFGTGYSSLAYLTQLPVQEIKIDRSFVIDLARHGDEVIVRSTIDLAHNLGMTVVAEGVETRATWDRLVTLGCDAAQGYYVSRAQPYEAITEWMKSWRIDARS